MFFLSDEVDIVAVFLRNLHPVPGVSSLKKVPLPVVIVRLGKCQPLLEQVLFAPDYPFLPISVITNLVVGVSDHVAMVLSKVVLLNIYGLGSLV